MYYVPNHGVVCYFTESLQEPQNGRSVRTVFGYQCSPGLGSTQHIVGAQEILLNELSLRWGLIPSASSVVEAEAMRA